MKLSQVKNYNSLLEYIKQYRKLKIQRFTPLPPYDQYNIKLLIHHSTPIAYIIGTEIFTVHYVKENFISMTTAKISTQLCEFSRVLSMEGFIYRLYDEFGCKIKGKNKPFIEAWTNSLIGD